MCMGRTLGYTLGGMIIGGGLGAAIGAASGATGAAVLTKAGYGGYVGLEATRMGAIGSGIISGALGAIGGAIVGCLDLDSDSGKKAGGSGGVVAAVADITLGGLVGYGVMNSVTSGTVMGLGQTAAASAVGGAIVLGSVGVLAVCCVCVCACGAAAAEDRTPEIDLESGDGRVILDSATADAVREKAKKVTSSFPAVAALLSELKTAKETGQLTEPLIDSKLEAMGEVITQNDWMGSEELAGFKAVIRGIATDTLSEEQAAQLQSTSVKVGAFSALLEKAKASLSAAQNRNKLFGTTTASEKQQVELTSVVVHSPETEQAELTSVVVKTM